LSLPDNQKFIELFDPPGRNYICLIFSGAAMDIKDLTLKIQNEKENFFRQRYVSGGHEIEWSRNEVSFEAPFKRESVMAVLIELDQVPK
jgi:hypothetical protein